jgi:hypothetical protein
MTRTRDLVLTVIGLAVVVGTIVFGILRLYTES